MRHTQEPWEADSDGLVYQEPSESVAAGEEASPHVCKADSYATAARIVKCVNACAGIEDPASELARLRRVDAAAQQAWECLIWNADDSRGALLGYIQDAQDALLPARED